MAAIVSQRSFRIMGGITIAAVYFLILVGGVVRASGAGMGCPDWPKCFGRWVPPTQESQLPANYQEIYAHRGYAEMKFNAFKTWTEYVNRLIGASIGLLIFVTLLFSFAYWRRDKAIVALSFLAFVLVGFNGWLGSVVVTTNLVPVIITLHMLAAFVLVGVLIYALARAQRSVAHYGNLRANAAIPWLIALVLLLSLAQLIFGTQVREQVDEIANKMGDLNRAQWVTEFGTMFYVHRTFSIVVLLANVGLAWAIIGSTVERGTLYRGVLALLALIGGEIIVGALLFYAGMPAVLQPVHLLLGSLVFGLQLYIWIAYRYARAGARSDAVTLR